MARIKTWLKDFDSFNFDKFRYFIWIGFSFLFLGCFLKITWELHEDSTLGSLDRQILVLISHFRVAALNGSAVDVTALGSPTIIGVITVIGVIILWLGQDKQGVAYLALGSAGSGVATFAMKHLFSRARPSVVPRLVEVSGFSYPSGHSLAATSLYLLLMFLSWRHFRSRSARIVLLCCALLLIFGVCFSRLYLGVHYPSDVLSGIFLGAAWVCLLTAYFSRSHASKG